MIDEIASEIKQAQIDLEKALLSSGLSVSEQDLDLRYTKFFNTHPGMASENLIGQKDEDWLRPSEAAKLTAPKKKALQGKVGVREVFKSTMNGGEEGDIYYNDVRVEPVWDKGKVVGIYTVAIDITEFQKALLKLEELNGKLLIHLEERLGGGK